jgi:glycolate oxidase FAD binding subunit
MSIMTPSTTEELLSIVRSAAGEGRRLEIRAGGSKSPIGVPRQEADILDMSGLAGIIDYDPAELVLTVRCGTPLAEVLALVASEGQMLAFEPFDHGPIFGDDVGRATIGGIVAAGVAGSRRVSAGAARDHVLRTVAVSGHGDSFVAGAKVVKNVTGYDLPKLLCGSWGRLAAISELTLKVLPRPQASTTLAYKNLSPDRASRLMLQAMASKASVAAAAHIPALGSADALTAIRLEGVEPSIRARIETLAAVLGDYGPNEALDPSGADEFWGQCRTLAPLANGLPLWRVNVPARAWVATVAALAAFEGRWIVDWAGNLLWLASAAPAALVREAAAVVGGHAMLVRGPAVDSALVPVFHPQQPGVTELDRRLRRAFDPKGVFETGRFGDSDAN